ncbi:M24 family metallopeptidase [Lutispora sp.]|jgi:Xaa-Pro dipeptidase|uniref:M24 family metallopeptidase n=1 Tax=Lutispora sp. TaxID=2828727 RepID=UPI003567C76F
MLDKSRLNKLVDILIEKNVDGCLMGPSHDVEYLAGIKPFSDERFRGFYVLSDGRWFFICPELYYEEVRGALGEEAHIYVWSDGEGVLGCFEKAKADYSLDGKSLAINEGVRAIDLIDMSEYMKCRYINGDAIFEELRIKKSEEEAKLMAEAGRIADRTFEGVIKFIKPGVSEKEIANKIKELLIEFGGEELSFEPIVASGPNSSKPHYNDDKRIIEEQDIIVLDFGCRYKGYCSDTSRTVFVGEPTEEQKKVYEICLRATTEAKKAVREGIAAEEVDKVARDIITKEGYGQYFINRTGHGIGMAVHEAPYIKHGNKQILETGMCFSVEPGIYIPGKFGMRIEDIVMVDGDKARVFNNSNRDMVIL